LKFAVSELAEFGARSWQIALISAPLAAILGETEPLVVEVEQAEAEPIPESD